jgi:hypothetical protein
MQHPGKSPVPPYVTPGQNLAAFLPKFGSPTFIYRKCLCIDGVVSALRVVEEKTVGEIEPSEAYRTADIPFQKI